ncbi:EamA family transporter [Alloscardovia macacae]|uniref:EamA family transporter n=1 Tax=Alloscardovia macacae TaxID=1160091 RepID=A0A1Y2SUP7_9BIFI|nr:DMT family transporter [Alloscardovia macacae]OTA25715.1 EamA family transporter [Alloscardovia macacae]OTA28334.1 EamA family transporter [Alloscardovia macacae]
MSKSLMGSLMVLSAGIAWGISGVSGQYLLEHGVSVQMLTSLRLLIAGAVLLSIVIVKRPESIRTALSTRSFLKGILLFSIFGLMANQFTYLKAIENTNAGTATVLQYLTPIIVLAYMSMKNRVPPALLEILATILAIVGTYLLATHGNLTSLAVTPAGLVWGIMSAFTYAAYIILPVALIRKWGSLLTIGLAMFMAGINFSLASGVWQYPFILDVPLAVAYFGIIGVGTIFAYTFFLKGTALVGAVQGSLLSSVEPVASVILTAALFGTTFYPADLLGMALILISALSISLKDTITGFFTRQGKVRS